MLSVASKVPKRHLYGRVIGDEAAVARVVATFCAFLIAQLTPLCTEALFNTNIEQCEALVRDKYLTNPWAMCMYSEAALWRFVFERKPEDWETGINRTKTAAAQAAVLQKRYKTKISKAEAEKCALYG